MAATEPQLPDERQARTPMGWFARAAIAYLLLELGAFAGLQLLDSSLGAKFEPVSTTELPPAVEAKLAALIEGEQTYLQHDPALGWSIRPNGTTRRYVANAQGIRANREYAQRAEPGVVRIATFGDSFTHGDDVDNASTWQAQLEPTLTKGEVLNFGVPAYGVDQAYLRYMEDGKEFLPNVILIGVMAENIYRGLNVWRPYYKPHYEFPLTKPRFRVQAGQLVLVPNPLPNLKAYQNLRDDPAAILPELAEHDALFAMQYTACEFDIFPTIRLGKMLNRKRMLADLSPVDDQGQYKVDHEAFEVLTGTLSAFVNAARKSNANVMVLIFPDNVLEKGAESARPYEPLSDWLTAQKIKFIDLQDGFDQHRGNLKDDELSVGVHGHYSSAANGIVARTLRNELIRLGWVLP